MSASDVFSNGQSNPAPPGEPANGRLGPDNHPPSPGQPELTLALAQPTPPFTLTLTSTPSDTQALLQHMPLHSPEDHIFDDSDEEIDVTFGISRASIFEPATPARPPLGERTPSRERVDWHRMLATVLQGEVLNQEKTRLTGGGSAESAKKSFIERRWLEIGSRALGRSYELHEKIIMKKRRGVKATISDVVEFRVSEGDGGEGKSPREQIHDLRARMDEMWELYGTLRSFKLEVPRVSEPEFIQMEETIIVWTKVDSAVEFQVRILRELINQRIDVASVVAEAEKAIGAKIKTGSFIQKILKEKNLATIANHSDQGLFPRIDGLVVQAKHAIAGYNHVFEERHFPSFIEDIQTLVNFPSRLMKSLLEARVRLGRRKLEKHGRGNVEKVERLMTKFHHLLDIAAGVKEAYINVIRPQGSWRLPECIEEGYDAAFLDALRFYFSLINIKLAASKNTEKETEILDEEWDRCYALGRYFEEGPLEIVLQFCDLTKKTVRRLTRYFVREIKAGDPSDPVRLAVQQKRLKSLLDMIRARQRKVFRFARGLSERIQNSIEYAIGSDPAAYVGIEDEKGPNDVEDHSVHTNLAYDAEGEDIVWLLRALNDTGHVLVEFKQPDEGDDELDTIVLASPELSDQPRKIAPLFSQVFRLDRSSDGPSYVLALRMPSSAYWPGKTLRVPVEKPKLNVAPNRLRLIASGMERVFKKARFQLAGLVRMPIACQPFAYNEVVKKAVLEIKLSLSVLSRAVMQSVDLIRRQTIGMPNSDDIVHRSFQFAADYGERSMNHVRGEEMNRASDKLMELALDWLLFICNDCDPSVGRTFRWSVMALEFTSRMLGKHLERISQETFTTIQKLVGQCMSLLVSHFDIMGARSLEQRRRTNGDNEDPQKRLQEKIDRLIELDSRYKLGMRSGRVLDPNNEADRALMMLSSVGRHVGIRWKQGECLGEGTSGKVHKGTDLDSGLALAVKEIKFTNPLLLPFIVSKIREEVRTLQRLQHHYIVRYYGIQAHREKVFIFMEYCGGGSLANMLQHGAIQDETVLQIYTHMMLEGLAYLHAQGIAHRDVKPQNILLTDEGDIKFVDFGTAKTIARNASELVNKRITDLQISPDLLETLNEGGMYGVDPEVLITAIQQSAEERVKEGESPVGSFNLESALLGTESEEMAGTPIYLPPEAVKINKEKVKLSEKEAADATAVVEVTELPGGGREVTSITTGTIEPKPVPTSAGDIWALGCVIIEMCTGVRPWSELDNEWAVLYSLSQNLAPMVQEGMLSDRGFDFLSLCFEPDPFRRKTAAELLEHEWVREVAETMTDTEEEGDAEA